MKESKFQRKKNRGHERVAYMEETYQRQGPVQETMVHYLMPLLKGSLTNCLSLVRCDETSTDFLFHCGEEWSRLDS